MILRCRVSNRHVGMLCCRRGLFDLFLLPTSSSYRDSGAETDRRRPPNRRPTRYLVSSAQRPQRQRRSSRSETLDGVSMNRSTSAKATISSNLRSISPFSYRESRRSDRFCLALDSRSNLFPLPERTTRGVNRHARARRLRYSGQHLIACSGLLRPADSDDLAFITRTDIAQRPNVCRGRGCALGQALSPSVILSGACPYVGHRPSQMLRQDCPNQICSI